MLKHSLRFLVHSPSIPRLRFPSYRMASTLPKLPIFEAISKHDMSSTAIIDSASNQAFTYGTLLRDVAAAKDHLSQAVSGSPIRGERVAFLAENSYNYVGRWYSNTKHAILTYLKWTSSQFWLTKPLRFPFRRSSQQASYDMS
jgi:hypothetical protein